MLSNYYSCIMTDEGEGRGVGCVKIHIVLIFECYCRSLQGDKMIEGGKI